MGLPCVVVSATGLPKVAESLRASGWEVEEKAISPEDWKIGVRFQAMCTINGECWCVVAQLVPNIAPSDFLLQFIPKPIGLRQWWKGMRAHEIAFAQLSKDQLIIEGKRG